MEKEGKLFFYSYDPPPPDIVTSYDPPFPQLSSDGTKSLSPGLNNGEESHQDGMTKNNKLQSENENFLNLKDARFDHEDESSFKGEQRILKRYMNEKGKYLYSFIFKEEAGDDLVIEEVEVLKNKPTNEKTVVDESCNIGTDSSATTGSLPPIKDSKKLNADNKVVENVIDASQKNSKQSGTFERTSVFISEQSSTTKCQISSKSTEITTNENIISSCGSQTNTTTSTSQEEEEEISENIKIRNISNMNEDNSNYKHKIQINNHTFHSKEEICGDSKINNHIIVNKSNEQCEEEQSQEYVSSETSPINCHDNDVKCDNASSQDQTKLSSDKILVGSEVSDQSLSSHILLQKDNLSVQHINDGKPNVSPMPARSPIGDTSISSTTCTITSSNEINSSQSDIDSCKCSTPETQRVSSFSPEANTGDSNEIIDGNHGNQQEILNHEPPFMEGDPFRKLSYSERESSSSTMHSVSSLPSDTVTMNAPVYDVSESKSISNHNEYNEGYSNNITNNSANTTTTLSLLTDSVPLISDSAYITADFSEHSLPHLSMPISSNSLNSSLNSKSSLSVNTTSMTFSNAISHSGSVTNTPSSTDDCRAVVSSINSCTNLSNNSHSSINNINQVSSFEMENEINSEFLSEEVIFEDGRPQTVDINRNLIIMPANNINHEEPTINANTDPFDETNNSLTINSNANNEINMLSRDILNTSDIANISVDEANSSQKSENEYDSLHSKTLNTSSQISNPNSEEIKNNKDSSPKSKGGVKSHIFISYPFKFRNSSPSNRSYSPASQIESRININSSSNSYTERRGDYRHSSITGNNRNRSCSPAIELGLKKSESPASSGRSRTRSCTPSIRFENHRNSPIDRIELIQCPIFKRLNGRSEKSASPKSVIQIESKIKTMPDNSNSIHVLPSCNITNNHLITQVSTEIIVNGPPPPPPRHAHPIDLWFPPPLPPPPEDEYSPDDMPPTIPALPYRLNGFYSSRKSSPAPNPPPRHYLLIPLTPGHSSRGLSPPPAPPRSTSLRKSPPPPPPTRSSQQTPNSTTELSCTTPEINIEKFSINDYINDFNNGDCICPSVHTLTPVPEEISSGESSPRVPHKLNGSIEDLEEDDSSEENDAGYSKYRPVSECSSSTMVSSYHSECESELEKLVVNSIKKESDIKTPTPDLSNVSLENTESIECITSHNTNEGRKTPPIPPPPEDQDEPDLPPPPLPPKPKLMDISPITSPPPPPPKRLDSLSNTPVPTITLSCHDPSPISETSSKESNFSNSSDQTCVEVGCTSLKEIMSSTPNPEGSSSKSSDCRSVPSPSSSHSQTPSTPSAPSFPPPPPLSPSDIVNESLSSALTPEPQLPPAPTSFHPTTYHTSSSPTVPSSVSPIPILPNRTSPSSRNPHKSPSDTIPAAVALPSSNTSHLLPTSDSIPTSNTKIGTSSKQPSIYSSVINISPYGKFVVDRKDLPLPSPEDEIRRIYNSARAWGWINRDVDTLAVYTQLDPIIQQGPQCGLVALSMASKIISPASSVDVKSLLTEARQRGISNHGEMFSAENMCHLASTLLAGVEVSVRKDVLQNPGILGKILLDGDLILVPYDAEPNHFPGCKGGRKAHWGVVAGCLLQSAAMNLSPHTSRSISADGQVDNLWHLRPNNKLSGSREVQTVHAGDRACSATPLNTDGDETCAERPRSLSPLGFSSKLSTSSNSWLENITTILPIWRQGKSRTLTISPLEDLQRSNEQLMEYPQTEEYIIGSLEHGLCGQVVVLSRNKTGLTDLIGRLQEEEEDQE